MPGSYQSEAGCTGDWDPACAATQLAVDGRRLAGHVQRPRRYLRVQGGAERHLGRELRRQRARRTAPTSRSPSPPTARSSSTTTTARTGSPSNRNATIATAPGSYQRRSAVRHDWAPDCLRSWLQDPDGDGTYTLTTSAIPAGSYEVKVAINESWDKNYGRGRRPERPQHPLHRRRRLRRPVTFSYNAASHVLTIGPAGAPPQADVREASRAASATNSVSGDWQPECRRRASPSTPSDRVWQGTFNVPPATGSTRRR